MEFSEEKQKICAEALKIASGDERWVYLQKHGVSGQDLWFYKRDYVLRDTALTRSRRHKARKLALIKQGHRCALCDTSLKIGPLCCLDKTGKVVCRACNQLLAAWRRARADSITEKHMIEFDTDVPIDTP